MYFLNNFIDKEFKCVLSLSFGTKETPVLSIITGFTVMCVKDAVALEKIRFGSFWNQSQLSFIDAEQTFEEAL